MSRTTLVAFSAALMILLTGISSGQDLAALEKRVTEFTLPNGMHFIIFERHDAPVVSFNAYVNAGSANDPARLRLPAPEAGHRG